MSFNVMFRTSSQVHVGPLVEGHRPALEVGEAAVAAPLGALSGLAAAGVHTVAMLGVALAVALLVYQVFGVGVLRRAWFNVDRLWAGVLVAAGLVTLIRA